MVHQKKITSTLLLALVTASLAILAGASTDAEIIDGIVQFHRPRCGDEPGRGGRRPELIEVLEMGGDTNRLARLLAELAHTNDIWNAKMALWELEKYGTAEQLPFLYSCATNPAVGDRAVKAALRIEGVTSSSIEAAQRYFALTNTDESVDRSRTSICADLIKLSCREGVDDICRSNAMEVAQNFASSTDCNFFWLDKLRLADDPSYRYSKRRLTFMRGAASHAAQWEFMANYVTNAINELVAYPEANLPD